MSSKVEKMENEMVPINTGPRFGTRHLQIILLFLLVTVAYAMRVCLSVSIVAMLDDTASKNPDVKTYDWTNKSVILSSFYWGYIVLQVLAGEIGKKYGAKWFLVGTMLLNTVALLVIPVVADTLGSYGVMGCRIIQGLSQGFFYPNVHNLMGKWAPADERSMMAAFVFSGSAFGTIVAMPITGMISASWVGWPVSFYAFGAVGLVWCLAWAIWGSNSPEEHSRISPEEKLYIETSLATIEKAKTPKTPWKAILTSMPVWAIVIGQFGQNWGFATLLTEIPNYLSGVMEYDMAKSGWISAAPYLTNFILSLLFGPLADYLITKNYLGRGTTRKVFNTIGTVMPAIALTSLGFVPDSMRSLSVALLVAAVGINAAVFCGFQVNHVDLSTKYAGILMGISNGSSNIFSIISPLVVQAVVGNDDGNKSLWRIIFITASAIYVASDIFYVVFASGERQWWDKDDDETEQKPQNKLEDVEGNSTSDKY